VTFESVANHWHPSAECEVRKTLPVGTGLKLAHTNYPASTPARERRTMLGRKDYMYLENI
jgi:hypothetical protein